MHGLPNDLVWNLDLKNPGPISVVDQHIPIGATIQGIGARHVGDEQVTTTAEGGHYSVRAEQIRGKDIVARIVRVRRVADR